MANYKHGFSGTRIHNIYREMKNRCINKDNKNNKNYGAKGIRVCSDWEHDFLVFKDWAFTNGYKDDLTIDRIDVKGNYEPDNCRWVSIHEQILNQERNKNRTKKDKYIKEIGINKYSVCIQRKRKNVLYQTAISFEEAVICRDYFLETGKKLDLREYDKQNYSNINK